jgi:hypothetical protein
MRREVATAIVAAILGLATACTGTETGNPSLRGQMGFAGKSSMALQVGLPGDGAPVEVVALHAYVASVNFVSADDCETGAEGVVELVGVGPVDLLLPEDNVRELDVRQDAYCAADLVLSAAPIEGVPADLAGRSLVLRGRRADGTPFVWSTAAGISVNLPVLDALFLIDAEHADHVLTLDVARMLSPMALDSAVVGGDGVAHLDAPENAMIGAMLNNSVGPATTLHRDPDGDGRHDDGEPALAHGDH